MPGAPAAAWPGEGGPQPQRHTPGRSARLPASLPGRAELSLPAGSGGAEPQRSRERALQVPEDFKVFPR